MPSTRTHRRKYLLSGLLECGVCGGGLASPERSNIRFHPNLAREYRNKVASLEEVLANPATHPKTVASIRSQIERITLTPNDQGTLDIRLYGDLARILQFCEASERRRERPGQVSRGVDCRWLRGPDLDFVHSS